MHLRDSISGPILVSSRVQIGPHVRENGLLTEYLDPSILSPYLSHC